MEKQVHKKNKEEIMQILVFIVVQCNAYVHSPQTRNRLRVY